MTEEHGHGHGHEHEEHGHEHKEGFFENIEKLVGHRGMHAAVVGAAGAEQLGEKLRDAIHETLSTRENVVMVRVNDDSLVKIDELVEAGVVGSRSEAAAFLIGEGIKARDPLFEKISEKIQDIRKAKEELKDILDG